MTLLATNTLELPAMWVISDTHFFHKAIVEYADRPLDHNELMLKNWLDLVNPDDYILHLGDLVLGSTEKFDKLAAQLTGNKWLLRGNHDHRKLGWYRKRGFLSADKPHATNYRGFEIHFSHFPQPRIPRRNPWAINVHGHIHEKPAPHERCVNVCVEQTDYKPVWITDVLDDVIEGLGYADLQVRTASNTT